MTGQVRPGWRMRLGARLLGASRWRRGEMTAARLMSWPTCPECSWELCSVCRCCSNRACSLCKCGILGAPPLPQVRPPLPIWVQLEDQLGNYCPECGVPWRAPSPGCPHRIRNVHPLTWAYVDGSDDRA